MTHSDFRLLLSTVKALSPEQVRELRQQLDREHAQPEQSSVRPPGRVAKRTKAAPSPVKKVPTPDEFNRRLLAAGRVAWLPDPAQDISDDDPDDAPVAVKGEPLSETIIRERR